MERTSLITTILACPAAEYDNIYLVDGLPDSTSLSDYFERCPFVTEKAELTEESEMTDQGDILKYSVQANTYREDTFHTRYAFKHLLIYIVTTSGERIFFGTPDNPVVLGYGRKSGASNGDVNDNSLTFSHIQPV